MVLSDLDARISELQPNTITVLGLPLDENSSFMHGPALAPTRIREVLHTGSTNLCAESGLDLATEPCWQDLGDLTLPSSMTAFTEIEQAITQLLNRDASALSLGGDHSVTYPILRAYAQKYPELNVLQLDAHPDLYDEWAGNRYSHACPFARIMEEQLVARLVQVGIRTMNPHQRRQAERFGVEVIEMRDWRPDISLDFDGPVYLSLDIDVLDPAFAPGISHHEPGGLTTRDVLVIIQNLNAPIVGADIVEFNPKRDPMGITAMVAVKFLKEIVAQMLEKIAGGR
ncbi:MAG: agmatinase [Candidatus Bipolaricaulia bacterium]